MRATELVSKLLMEIAVHGDNPVCTGNMEELDFEEVETVDSVEAEEAGAKYLHIGAW